MLLCIFFVVSRYSHLLVSTAVEKIINELLIEVNYICHFTEGRIVGWLGPDVCLVLIVNHSSILVFFHAHLLQVLYKISMAFLLGARSNVLEIIYLLCILI